MVERIAAFLEMGGYAVFVWPSFGLSIAVLAVLLVASLHRMRACERALGELEGAQSATGKGVGSEA